MRVAKSKTAWKQRTERGRRSLDTYLEVDGTGAISNFGLP